MEVFIARQPIFDRNMKVYGYELLFRSGKDNFYSGTNPEDATSQVIVNSFLIIGIDKITGGKKAFINFTEKLLLNETPLILPKTHTVIEILEDVRPLDCIIEKCNKYKKQGYTLALDDFNLLSQNIKLLPLCDIIKVDFSLVKYEDRKKFSQILSKFDVKLLAEKVQTIEDFNQAMDLNYDFFQGYYFEKPLIIKSSDIPMASITKVKMLNILSREGIDYDGLEAVINEDVSMSYKLYHYINSSIFGFKDKIDSVKRALVLMGKNEIYKWVALMLVRDFTGGYSDELIKISISRAKFCELLAQELLVGKNTYEYYLLGLFSNLDVLLNKPMNEIVNELTIPQVVKEALIGNDNTHSSVLKIVQFYEKAMWDQMILECKKIKINPEKVTYNYVESINWAQEIS